jgi:hypothetical protein
MHSYSRIIGIFVVSVYFGVSLYTLCQYGLGNQKL